MRKMKYILPLLALVISLCACQAEPVPQEEPLAPVIEFVRTSIQVQPDNSYAIWEYAADNSKIRLTTYNAAGYLQYRIDYDYDQQGRVAAEQSMRLEDTGTVLTHTNTYHYDDVEVVVGVSDFGYEGTACSFTMTDPNHHVNIKDIGVADGKVTELTIEELDEEGVWVTEQRIVLDK